MPSNVSSGPTAYFDKLLPILNRSQIIAGTLDREIFVAEDINNKVIGDVVWYNPREHEDQSNQALAPLVENFPSEVKEWYMNCAPRMERFKKETFGDFAKTKWYLQRVGIHPDWQGKDVGTALIEYGGEKINGRGIALQAVEPSNIGYYEYLGFKNKGHIDIEAFHGNFTVTGFIWDP